MGEELGDGLSFVFVNILARLRLMCLVFPSTPCSHACPLTPAGRGLESFSLISQEVEALGQEGSVVSIQISLWVNGQAGALVGAMALLQEAGRPAGSWYQVLPRTWAGMGTCPTVEVLISPPIEMGDS